MAVARLEGDSYRFDQYQVYYGKPAYDWVSPGLHNQTPQESPYGFSGYYLWRDFKSGDRTVDGVYSDRMAGWEPEKWAEAMRGRKQNWQTMSRSEAEAIIKIYYGGRYTLVGYATECNVSNGYPVGIFFIRDTQKPKEEPIDG